LLVAKIGAPALALSKLLDTLKPLTHQAAHMRYQNQASDPGSDPSPPHRKPDLVAEFNDPVAHFFQPVIVFEFCKSAGEHAVSKKPRRIERLDRTLVFLREAKLPSAPKNRVSIPNASLLRPLHGCMRRSSATIATHVDSMKTRSIGALTCVSDLIENRLPISFYVTGSSPSCFQTSGFGRVREPYTTR